MSDYSTYKAEDLLMDDNFIQYCLGNAAATAFWNNFLITHPKMQQEILKAKKIHASISIRVPENEKQIALIKLKNALAVEKQSPLLHPAPAPVYPITSFRWKAGFAVLAAAVVIGLVIVSALWFAKKQSSNLEATPVAAFAKTRFKDVIQSQFNRRKEVTLPDGSVVTLNYGSTVKLADDYNEDKRWIYLEGEAFFSVMPNKEKPFVVITKMNATTALGTSFKVRSYPGETVSDIMLATGKVKVQSMSDKNSVGDITLLPGEKATCENNNLPLKSTFDLDELLKWRYLKIELEKANLDVIIATLEFNYGIRVKLQNKPVKEFAFTGRFDNKSLQNVLEAISFTNKFSYTQKGNIVSILFQ